MPSLAPTTWSEALRSAGNPAQRLEQQNRRKTATNRLLELEQTEQNFAKVGAQRDSALGTLRGKHTGFESEHDYRGALNRRGEIADLTSRLTGKGGVNVAHTYAGTDFARRPAGSTLRQAAMPEPAESDNLDYFARQEMLRRMQIENEGADSRMMEESLARLPGVQSERQRVAREQLAANAGFMREEGVKDARAAGDASVARYGAEDPIRSDKRSEEDAAARRRGFYDPRVKQAEIEAGSRSRESESARRGERAAALKALSDLTKQQASVEPEIEGEEIPGTGTSPFRFLGGGNLMEFGRQRERKPNPQWEALQRSIDDSRRMLGGEDTGGAEKTLSQQEVEDVAAEKGISVEEALALAKQYGYAVR